ncbi:hypothetical protein [Rheinheimera tilapiae]|uniref:Lipoprotein n=1 Tax=Rheinheimera tilapiae TaxID=875043 RepID=A0ABV6BCP9_9GAMM
MKLPCWLLLPLCSTLFLTGCDHEIKSGDHTDVISFDFRHGSQNWTAGFSDYLLKHAPLYELESGLRDLPAGFQGTGFMLSGHNRSADLFMFLKRKISGLSPSSRYRVELKVTFLSPASKDCVGVGIGGSPGESVWLKFGYADKEPQQDGFTLNVPKGDQSQDGTQAKVQGNIATDAGKCDNTVYRAKTLKNTEKALELTTDAQGSVWLFVGTDSGFEGKTTLYYQQIEVKFTPR